jgi:lysyl-tRNA synthetase class I
MDFSFITTVFSFPFDPFDVLRVVPRNLRDDSLTLAQGKPLGSVRGPWSNKG